MSNALTRKGIAVGVAVALAFTALVGATPASAAGDNVTLTPSNGDTYNSIRESGVTLNTLVNPASVDTGEDTLVYYIESVDPAVDIFSMLNAASPELIVSYENEDITNVEDNMPTGEDFSIFNVSEDGNVVLVSAENDGFETGTNVNELEIRATDSATNKNIEIKVTAWVDRGTENFELDAFEPASAERTIKLFDRANVTATTTVQPLEKGDTAVSAVVSFNNDINPYFATYFEDAQDAFVVVTFYKDGYAEGYNTAGTDADGVISASLTTTVGLGNYSARAALWEPTEGDDSFLSWVGPQSATVSLVEGVSSVVTGLDVIIEDTTTTNELSSTAWEIKEGQKSLVVTAQALDGLEDLAEAGIRVKANLYTYSDNFDNSSEATLSGTTSKISDDEDAAIVSYGKTNAAGQVVFTIGNSGAVAEDQLELELSFMNKDGAWVSATPASTLLEWKTPDLYDFDVDLEATSGSSVTINYDVLDQFGGGINVEEDENLEVTVVAYDETGNGNIYDSEKLLKNVVVPASGKVSVTFPNFVTVDDGQGAVTAFLHKDIYAWEDQALFDTTPAAPASHVYEYSVDTQLFRNGAVAEIDSLDKTFSTEVTYGTFYPGNYDDSLELANKINESDYEVGGVRGVTTSDYAIITGSVVTSTGGAAKAQAVTITGSADMHFEFDGYNEVALGGYQYGYDRTFSTKTATVYTDTDGTFSFRVYSHKVAEAGQSITITSGGKSTVVTLLTFHNDEIDDESEFSKVTYSFNNYPGLGVNVVGVNVKDRWLNPFKGAEVDFEDQDTNYYDDYVIIDGSGDDGARKYTDANGDTSARIQTYQNGRSVAAPGAFNVEVNYWYYDINGDGDESDDYEFSESDDNAAAQLYWEGFFGAQATAQAGAKAGVAKVAIFNAQGKTVKVYVNGKLKKTINNQKRVNKVKLTGLKKGAKSVSVVIGKSQALTKSVTIK